MTHPFETSGHVRHDLLGGDEEHEILGAEQRCAEAGAALNQIAFLSRSGNARNEVVSSQTLWISAQANSDRSARGVATEARTVVTV